MQAQPERRLAGSDSGRLGPGPDSEPGPSLPGWHGDSDFPGRVKLNYYHDDFSSLLLVVTVTGPGTGTGPAGSLRAHWHRFKLLHCGNLNSGISSLLSQ